VNGRDDRHGLELAMGAVLVLGLGVAALVWAATVIGALATGDPIPQISAGALVEAVLALPHHLSDPRDAWPAQIRARIPGTFAFYVALTGVLSIAAGLIGLLSSADIQNPFSGGRDTRESGARWGKRRELARLRAPRRRRRLRPDAEGEKGRLALGYHGRGLLRGEARHALVVFGPPQSGKSAGIAIPSLLEWDGPAVASSIKTDLYSATARRRRALGEVMVFDPYGLAPVRGSTWSPLRLSTDWDGALSTAQRISAAGELDTSNVKGGSYWTAAAEQRLAPLLWAAARTQSGIGAVVRWAYGQGDAELPSILHHLMETATSDADRSDAQAAYDAHVAFEALAGDTRSSIESTVQMLVRAYRSPRVQVSAIGCEITPERLLAKSNTLYLIGDSHRGKLLRPIFLALLQELIDHAYQDATMRGGRLDQPLLLCLDELGNVAPLPNLAEVASTAPSHNIQLVSIFHDLAQARSRYGDQAHTVINSHRARMLLPGVADLETLRYFSDLLGEERYRDSDDATAERPGPRERQPLAAPQQLRQLAEGEALLIYGRLPPSKLRLRTYFGDRWLRDLADDAGRRS
jgi:type IV secretion system protein VirD4